MFVFFLISDNVKCLESYPTLHKVANHSTGLYYSDHLAVYALLELDETADQKSIPRLKSIDTLDEQTTDILRSGCLVVEQSIQRIQRERVFFACAVFCLAFILFSFNGNPLTNGYLYMIFTIIKDVLCLIVIAVCVWFICLGKPVERNALSSIQNAMRVRLQSAQFSY